MFNNRVQNGKSEFQNFMEGPEKKLKLGVGRNIYCEYAFFIDSASQDDIVDILSIISKNNLGVQIEYDMIEESNSGTTKVIFKLLFENVDSNPKKCFLSIATFLAHTKAILDKYAKDIPKEYSMNVSFFVKNLERYNTVLVQQMGEIVEYKEKLLPRNFCRYTKHVNYNIDTFKNLIVLKGYTGNVEKAGFLEVFYEIANCMIQFNNEIVCNMK